MSEKLRIVVGSDDAGHAYKEALRKDLEASGLVAAHLQWHLERGLRSLPLVDRR